MKQFQKYGVAAAVASVATGVVATEVSKKELGDLAIVPYYTVLDGKNTGIHIINTTPATQVVKVRLRRGADSADALDFNLIMSPYDEWTANLGANPNGPGVQVSTNDTTCTAPKFENDGKTATMPTTFATGAEEGYLEIIGMGQPVNVITLDDDHAPGWQKTQAEWDEFNSLSMYALHDEGVPVSCDIVRQHFYRIYDGTSTSTSVGDDEVRGVHYGNLTSSALCTAGDTRTGGACDSDTVWGILTGTDDYPDSVVDGNARNITAAREAARQWFNLVAYRDTPDDALKVSWMITDSEGGLEIGDNAVMVTGHSNAGDAMMTNQVPLNFGANGKLRYDPLNFELPNLAYGAWARSKATDNDDGTTLPSGPAAKTTEPDNANSMFDHLRAALDAEAVVNDWAAFDTDSGSVATDWVVTLPGQYVMNNNTCALYSAYAQAATACFGARTATAAEAAAADPVFVPLPGAGSGNPPGPANFVGVDPRVLDADELPLVLASNDTANPIGGDTNLLLWDREEGEIFEEVDTPDDELGFSPGGASGDPTLTAVLNREVNVIKFNDGDVLGTAAQQDEPLGLGFTVTVPGDTNKGWGMLTIAPVGNDFHENNSYIWAPGDPVGGVINPNDARETFGGTALAVNFDGWGHLTRPLANPAHTAVVAFAAWERSFADQAGNYGRAVEHSTISSTEQRMSVEAFSRLQAGQAGI